MADPRYLNPDLTYNRGAMMRSAWATARAMFAKASAPGRFAYATTLRAEFKEALRRLWDQAKCLRGIALWRRETEAQAQAEAARRDALPANVVAIEDARAALRDAEMSDSVTSHEHIAAARARLASLELAA